MQESPDQRPAEQKPEPDDRAVRENFGRFLLRFPGPLQTERNSSPMRDVNFGEDDA